MGTWQLVEKPEGAVPIRNKWVLVKKHNKAGEIIKYKARMVAKGCAQRPGYDYLETHSPVVRMETIRAILAVAATRKLFIYQLDIKGAYLNGKLKQRVYMRQLLQSTDQFFHFPLLWTTQYTAHSTTPSTYKYSTCTCTRTSCPAHIILTACPTCLQPIPYQPPPSIRCHRLLRAPPRLWPATATSGKPASPTSATFP